MKATKKLLLLAFAVALMITMFVAFAVTAAAAETTLDFDTNAVTGEITYGDEYPSVLESAISMYGPSVAKTDVTIALINQSGKVYEPGDPAGTYYLAIVSGKFGGNTEVTNLTYTITSGSFRSQLDLGNGDVLYFNTVAVTVKPKPITVTLTGTVASKVYDGTTTVLAEQVTGLTAEYTGLFGTDTLDTVITGTYAGENVATGIALTLNVALAGEKAGNYTLENPTATTFTADITRRSLTVVLTNPSKVYGEADDLAYTLEGAVAGEIPASDTLLTRDAGQDVGLYTVHTNLIVLKDNGDFLEANYAISAEEVKYEITKKAITVAYDWTGTNFFTFNNNKVYVTITSAVKDQLIEADKAGLNSFEISTSADDVGVYVYGDAEKYVNIKPTFNAGYETLFDNYDITYNISLEIKPLEIVVDLKDTINAQYRGEAQSLTDTNSGTFLTYTPTIYGTYSVKFITTGKDVGNYSFADGTLVLGAISVMDGTEDETANYSFVVNTASTYVYKINKFAITVTVIDDTKVYDANAYVVDLTKVTVDPYLWTGDAFTGTITTTFVNAGTYKTSDSTADTTGWTTNLDSNYEITWVVDVTINKAAITVTVNASVPYSGEKVTVNYDDARVTVEGLMSGHTLSAGMFVTSSENAGTYANAEAAWTTAIAVSDGVDDVTANYAITYAGNVEITKKVLTIETVTIANPYYYNGTNVLAAADVVVTFSGLVGSEALIANTDYTISDASWDGVNATTSGVKFTIALLSTAVADNYQIEAAQALDATGTNNAIKKCVVTVDKFIVDASYDRYYDGTTKIDPSMVTAVLKVSSGKGKIVAADALTAIFDADDIAWQNKNAQNDKNIILNTAAGHAKLSDTENYEWKTHTENHGSNGSIRPAKLYIVPDANQSKVYGSADPVFTYKYYVEGKTIADLNVTYDADVADFTGVLNRVAGEYVNTYAYDTSALGLADNGTFKAANYVIAGLCDDAATFEITKRTITVTPEAKKQIYFDAAVELTYKFVIDPKDLVMDLSALTQDDLFTGALTREEGDEWGDYKILQGTVALKASDPADLADPANNFEISYTEGILYTIEKAIIKLVADPIVITYGEQPVYTFSVVVTNDANAHKINEGLTGIKMTDLTTEADGSLSLTLKDGKTKLTFKAEFIVAFLNNMENIPAGTYTISFHYADELGIDDSALAKAGSVEYNVTKTQEGTLTVKKKLVKLGFKDVTVKYGEEAKVEIIVVGDGALVGNDTFESAFIIKANKYPYTTTYTPGQPVGTYDIVNDANVFDMITSQNYEVESYGDPADVATQMKVGTITVEKATIYVVVYDTVNAAPTDKEHVVTEISKVYGAADPTFGIAYLGVFGTQVPMINVELEREPGDAVGHYGFNIYNNPELKFVNNEGTGFYADNYVLEVIEVDFKIVAATVKLSGTIKAPSQEYDGGLLYNQTIDLSGLTKDVVAFDLTTLVISNVAFDTKNVGVKTLTFTLTTTADEYNIDATDVVIEAEITARTVVVSGITAENRIYDGTQNINLIFANVVFDRYVEGDDLGVTAVGTLDEKNAGDRNVTISGLTLTGDDATNYVLAVAGQQTSTTAFVYQKTIVISGITAHDKIYDGNKNVDFDIPEQAISGLVEGDNVFVEKVTGEFNDANVAVGKPIDLSIILGGADAANYTPGTGSQTQATASITPATLTIVIDNKTAVYGDAEPEFTFELIGFVNGETKEDLVNHGALTIGTLDSLYDVNVPALRVVREYPIKVATEFTATNYVFEVLEGELEITKATLNVTVDDAKVEYGSEIPEFTWTANKADFKWDDTVDVISGTAQYTHSYIKGAPVQNYVVSVSGLTAENYNIVTHSGTLTVTKATLTITPNNTTVVYGEGAKCDGYTVDGLVNGDTEAVISGTVTFGFVDFVENNGAVGEYKIVIELGNLSATNYDFNYDATGILTVEKATLTIKPNDATAVYGNAFVNNGYTFVGLVNGDTTVELSGDVDYAVDYVVGDDVGTYVITAVVDGLTTDNYVIVAGEGTLTVTKAALTIKPYAKDSITYGDLAPAQNFYYYDAVAGLIDGDVLAEQVTGTAAYTTDYQQNSNAGKYNIYVTGIDAKNYEITYVEGTLTVDKKALTVKPVDTTITFGDEPTCVGYTLVGLTPYDNAITELNALVGFTGELTYSYTYEQYMNVGNYVITSVIDAIESTNYYFETADATLTVEAYKLNGYITANGETVLNIIYGTETPAYAVVLDAASQLVADGAANSTYNTNDIVFVFDGYVEGDYVGEYTVTVALNGTENFVIEVIAPATVNVAKRNITITADDINVEYGDEPAYTISFGDMGLADCDTIVIDGKVFINPERTHIVVNNKFTTNYSETDPAGTTYLILMGLYTFESENYNVVAKYDGKLTVVKRVIDVTLNEVDVIYGNDIDFTKFTYAVEHERFVEGDDFATIFGIAVENLYTKITSNYVAGTVIADAGKVTYTLDGVTADNYVINFNYEGTVIAQREITLTINDFTVVYGDEPNQEGQFTLGDKFGTDVVDVTLVYGGYEKGVANAGETFEITATTTNVNYTLVFEAATLTVTKRAVTITVGDWRAMYGFEPSYDLAGAKIEGFFADQGVNYVITSDYIVGNNVGDYVLNIKAEDITAKDGTLLSNYEITVVPGNLEIYQRTFIINVNDATIVYGDEANSEGYGYTEFVMPGMITEDVITGITFKFNTKADGTGEDYKVGSPVGTYYIIAVCEANANYAVFAYAGELTVVPKNVTVTINDSTVEYKQPAAANGYVADGILAEDIAAFEAALKYTFGDYVCDAEKPEYSPAGKYVLSAVLLENYEDAENYNITFVDGTLNVTKIKITITVRVTPITYGDAFEGDASVTISEGFEALVTGAPVYTVPEYNTEDANMRGAGDYEVKITGIELVDAENYYIEYVGNTLVVEQYKVTVTANNGTATYADAEAVLNGFTIPTLPYGDDISANFSVTSAYEQGVTVAGTYPITVVAEKAELDNYTFTLVEGTLTVSKKVIKFTVANGYISYGDAEPDYEITFEEGAFFGTDTFENDVFGMIDIDAKGYSVGSPVSGSPYIVTVTTYLASEKYDVQYTGNTYLYVAKRTLTIKADDKSVEYGEGYPEFTYTIEGTFAPGEEMADIGVIKFNPTYSYDADSRDAAGTYAINVTFATTLPAISNYDVYFEAGELVVTPKALVITPEDTVMLKGGETPVIKYTYTGVVGDDVVTFYGALGTKATDVENVYDITMGTLVVLSPNYTLVLDKNSTAQFKVLDVTITVDGASVSLKNDVIMNFFFTVNFATGTEIVLSENEWGILQWTEEEYKALESYLFDSEYANYGEMDGHTLKVNGDAVAAKDYSKTYYVRAFVAVENGDETYYVYSDVFAYSVATYGKTVMSNDAFAKERPVVIAMLDYGAAAQKYFKDNSELANSFITYDMREAAGYTGYDESMNPSIDKASKIEGVTYNENLVWYGANASFGETFELYFHGIKIDDSYVISGDDANFGIIYWTEADRVDGKFTLEEGKYHNATVEEGRYGYYVFTVEDIVAREADERIYAAMWVKDAEGNVSYSYVTYTSVKDYAYAMMSLKDNANYDHIVSLGKATIAYIEAAKAYFNK